MEYGENCIILTSTVLTDPPLRQTDRRTGDSIKRALYYVQSRAK